MSSIEDVEKMTPEEQQKVMEDSQKPKVIVYEVGINDDRTLNIKSSEPVSFINIGQSVGVIKAAIFNNEINTNGLEKGLENFLYFCQVSNNEVIENMAKIMYNKVDEEGKPIYTEEQITSALSAYYAFCTGGFNVPESSEETNETLEDQSELDTSNNED